MSEHLVYHDVGATLRALSGILFMALGIAVFSIRPRLRANTAFAAFAFSTGLAYTLRNVWPGVPVGPATTPLFSVQAIALLLVALWFPRPLRRSEINLLVLPGTIWLLDLITHSYRVASGDLPITEFSLPSFWGPLMILVLRFDKARRDGEETEWRQLALVSAALVLFPAYMAGEGGLYGNGYGDLDSLLGQGYLFLALVLATTWFVVFLRADGPAKRAARNLAFLGPAIIIATALLRIVGGAEWVQDGTGIGRGIIRAVAVLAFAYAIVRHQLFGIDVKVRWTISKTTLAGFFVAVFFVASEAAQEFFGATLGGAYYGIAAAGLLVFALAPLSRLADRVAAHAVPAAPDPTRTLRSEDEATFRTALEKFLRDGHVTRDEERYLARLATRLGIDAERALALRHEVEDAGQDTGVA